MKIGNNSKSGQVGKRQNKQQWFQKISKTENNNTNINNNRNKAFNNRKDDNKNNGGGDNNHNIKISNSRLIMADWKRKKL